MPKESRIKKTLDDCLSRCVGTRFYGMKVNEDYHSFVAYKNLLHAMFLADMIFFQKESL